MKKRIQVFNGLAALSLVILGVLVAAVLIYLGEAYAPTFNELAYRYMGAFLAFSVGCVGGYEVWRKGV